jgi:alpha-amylase/alpha-mannosidase (GH57 family)
VDKNEFYNRKSLINRLNDLKIYTDIGVVIEKFWIDEENRKTKNWIDHRDINTVMLATTLAPQGFLRVIKNQL